LLVLIGELVFLAGLQEDRMYGPRLLNSSRTFSMCVPLCVRVRD